MAAEHVGPFDNGSAWERASALYLERRGTDVSTISYGNLAPGEDELNLLGNLHGKQVLDFGCGGGHNAVACALVGAAVTGLDVSQNQLFAAQELAALHGVKVQWRQGDETALAQVADGAYDLLLAIQVLPYVTKLDDTLRHFARLLRPGGRLVMSVDHPMRNCFFDAEQQELNPYPARRYDDSEPLLWYFDDDVPVQSKHLPLGAWVQLVIDAGMRVQRIVEAPAPPELGDELWPEDSPLAPLRNIPHTLIVLAER